MLGEAVLQLMAGTEKAPDGPFSTVFPYFFIPYKAATAGALLLSPGFREHHHPLHAAGVGLSWTAALLIYLAAAALDGRNSRQKTHHT